MAANAEQFFGEVAEGPKVASASKTSEQFFADAAAGKEKPLAISAAAKKKESFTEQGRRIQRQTLEAAGNWYSASPVAAIAELGASAVTGVVGGAEGLARGTAALIRGEGTDAASDLVRESLDKRTYQPRSDASKLIGKGLSALEENVFQPIAAPIEEAIGPEASKFIGSFGEGVVAAAPGMAAARAVPSAARMAARPRGVPTGGGPRPIAPGAAPGEALEAVPPRTADVLEMPRGPAPEPAPGLPQVPGRAPGSVDLPESKPVQPKPLEAKGGARERPYTELEGNEAPKFVEDTPALDGGKQLPQDHQVRRAQILNDIGIVEPRLSAVTGDVKAAATDFQSSKLDTPGGDYMNTVFDGERQALESYSGRLVAETQGTPGLGQTEILQRGQNIVGPLDDLKAYFDDGIKALYREADETAQGVPMRLIDTKKLMGGERSAFSGSVEGEALYRGTVARMQELGVIDGNGRLGNVTVQQAEQLKQYLNDQWSPRNSRLIRKLKDSIDDDVTRSAGTDIYQRARALRAARGKILDDPKGISRLMDADGPEGINRAVAIEKIPDTLATLPVAQFQHIVKTLRGVPPELQPAAQMAINEIKAQFASKIFETGSKHATQWNAKGVSQYLNANSARMNSVFTPEEMRQFATLNDAGHILKFPSSYPGAAVQAHNIAKAGFTEGIETAATTAGAAIGGAFGMFGGALGAAVGRKAGTSITTAIEGRKSLKAAQQRTTKLSDLLKVGKEEKK